MAEITGVDINLIQRFANIVSAINSERQIDVQAYEQYARGTVDTYNQDYSRFYMPASVHKLLMHGGRIIRAMLLPLGNIAITTAEVHHSNED